MLTQATQAAIAILHDISTGIYFRSANFRFTEEEGKIMFHKLEEGHIIRLLPNCEANIISSYVLCRSLNDLSLLDILEALGEPYLLYPPYSRIPLFAEYASRSKDRRAQPGYADASDRNQNIRLVTV